jgi:hypothetical protein
VGDKTRTQIRNERAKSEYLAYQRLLNNPGFIETCKRDKELGEKLEEIESQLEKLSLPKKLILPKNTTRIINADHPQYRTVSKIYRLQKEHRDLNKERNLLKRKQMQTYGLIVPINPLTEGEWQEQHFSGTGSIFKEMQIVESIPFQEPRWEDLDYSNYLEENRYVTLQIDTFHKKGDIISAIQNELDSLEGLGIIQFKEKVHLKTEEERIRAEKLRAEGKLEKEIAYILWPDKFQEAEEKIRNKIKLLTKEEKNLREQYKLRLLAKGKTKEQAREAANRKFKSKETIPTNSQIVRVHSLLKKK